MATRVKTMLPTFAPGRHGSGRHTPEQPDLPLPRTVRMIPFAASSGITLLPKPATQEFFPRTPMVPSTRD